MSCDYRQILRAAVSAGYLDDEPGLAGFIDINSLSRTITSLQRAFPGHFRHTFAAKANTMSCALAQVKAHGLGCEVASPGELEQAVRAGFTPESIVYDEPAKTRRVLQKVLGAGISLNIDNFQEFDRVRSLVREKESRSRIGFRINPQVGAGSISAMSTATATSKFGFALEDEGQRRAIINCYRDNSWLTSLHTHVGSQGCSLDLMTAGIRKTVDLAEEINRVAG
jgi:diaminopimelate decarboxylase